jgi:cytosine/adenosine deaminase-related metal-dependent hydrolase
MRAIRAAVLTVRLSIDYSDITERLLIAANAAVGTAAVLLAGFVAVAMGLN